MEVEISTQNKKSFCWFSLSGKALTWDVLVMKGREGPGRCFLYKMDYESNFHIGVDCPFTQNVWLIIEDKLKCNNIWSGETMSECFKTWRLKLEVANFKPLPTIVLWFIWKAINLSCF